MRARGIPIKRWITSFGNKLSDEYVLDQYQPGWEIDILYDINEIYENRPNPTALQVLDNPSNIGHLT